jgi:hypothetical protein
MDTRVVDPEVTKVCKPSSGLPVRYRDVPASREVLDLPDFSITAEQLFTLDLEIERRIALGAHPALAIAGILHEKNGVLTPCNCCASCRDSAIENSASGRQKIEVCRPLHSVYFSKE